MLNKILIGILAMLMITQTIVLTADTSDAQKTVPPQPHNFAGYVYNGTSYAPVGVNLTAEIDGTQYAVTTTFDWSGATVYTIDVPGDDGETDIKDGGVSGDTIIFRVDGYYADQIGSWTLGGSTTLDIYYNVSGQPVPLVINEIMPQPLYDFNGNGTFEPNDDEYITIWNPALPSRQLPVNLSAYYIGDNDGVLTQLWGSVDSDSSIYFYGNGTGLKLHNTSDEVKLLWDSPGQIANGTIFVIDRVEYGPNTTAPDETILSNAPTPPANQSIKRVPDGWDTDDPENDFQIVPEFPALLVPVAGVIILYGVFRYRKMKE